MFLTYTERFEYPCWLNSAHIALQVPVHPLSPWTVQQLRSSISFPSETNADASYKFIPVAVLIGPVLKPTGSSWLERLSTQEHHFKILALLYMYTRFSGFPDSPNI
ncbi:hypothetical protein NEOLEDRAFT_1134393 [Neolentinus lepideus HHB14362 ss-1]|uniref:Uncharacterized protein n=1 Tax=Neolentinus lepideus HHB14362 ss-1 TaxID=1314782 RepID=A0A165S7G1_9AGAM|nr:hypothetical protein NEOLEDRAFT_1134393 [Neolentinus lepideus HHB14362 ss-1]